MLIVIGGQDFPAEFEDFPAEFKDFPAEFVAMPAYTLGRVGLSRHHVYCRGTKCCRLFRRHSSRHWRIMSSRAESDEHRFGCEIPMLLCIRLKTNVCSIHTRAISFTSNFLSDSSALGPDYIPTTQNVLNIQGFYDLF